MFPIWINDGRTPPPQKDIYYELAANGFFIHKKTALWNAVVPVDHISILEPGEPCIDLHVPPLPAAITLPIISFFAYIAAEQNTEAAAVLWYNQATNEYDFSIPSQRVGYGHADYAIPDPPPGMIFIGTIHSHGKMSAFHSSTDRSDENTLDGIHITIGSLHHRSFFTSNNFSVVASVVVNGTRFKMKPEQWLEGVRKVIKRPSPQVAQPTPVGQIAAPVTVAEPTPAAEPYEPKAEEREQPVAEVKERRYWWNGDCAAEYALVNDLGEEADILPSNYKPPKEWNLNIRMGHASPTYLRPAPKGDVPPIIDPSKTMPQATAAEPVKGKTEPKVGSAGDPI